MKKFIKIFIEQFLTFFGKKYLNSKHPLFPYSNKKIRPYQILLLQLLLYFVVFFVLSAIISHQIVIILPLILTVILFVLETFIFLLVFTVIKWKKNTNN